MWSRATIASYRNQVEDTKKWNDPKYSISRFVQKDWTPNFQKTSKIESLVVLEEFIWKMDMMKSLRDMLDINHCYTRVTSLVDTSSWVPPVHQWSKELKELVSILMMGNGINPGENGSQITLPFTLNPNLFMLCHKIRDCGWSDYILSYGINEKMVHSKHLSNLTKRFICPLPHPGVLHVQQKSFGHLFLCNVAVIPSHRFNFRGAPSNSISYHKWRECFPSVIRQLA